MREEYVYDAGDNMLTKQVVAYAERIRDDFTDGDITAGPAWTTAAGTWAVDTTGKYLKNTTSLDSMWLSNTAEDIELWGRYRIDAASGPSDYIEFLMLSSSNHSPGDYVSVRVHEDKIQLRERYNNVVTTEDLPIASVDDQWYEFHIRVDGSTIEISRGEDGKGLVYLGRKTGLQTVNTNRVAASTDYQALKIILIS